MNGTLIIELVLGAVAVIASGSAVATFLTFRRQNRKTDMETADLAASISAKLIAQADKDADRNRAELQEVAAQLEASNSLVLQQAQRISTLAERNRTLELRVSTLEAHIETLNSTPPANPDLVQ